MFSESSYVLRVSQSPFMAPECLLSSEPEVDSCFAGEPSLTLTSESSPVFNSPTAQPPAQSFLCLFLISSYSSFNRSSISISVYQATLYCSITTEGKGQAFMTFLIIRRQKNRAWLRLFKIMLLYLVPDLARRDAEDAGGLCLVPAGLCKRLAEFCSFDIFNGRGQGILHLCCKLCL
jgi:hypothetical protein